MKPLKNSVFIDSNGVKIHAISIGEGDPIVMIHGLGVGNISTWYLNCALPLSKKRQVIIYDQRGHGLSDTPSNGYDPGTLTKDLCNVLAHYGINNNISIIAHSYGGIIALNYALQWKQQVKDLTLVDVPYPIQEFMLPQLDSLKTLQDIIELFPVKYQEDYQKGNRNVVRLINKTSAVFFETNLIEEIKCSTPLCEEKLSQLNIPIHGIYGKESFCIGSIERITAFSQQCHFNIMDCGHHILNEDPVGLKNIILEQSEFH